MEKPDGHPPKDKTILWSSGKLSESSSKPMNGNNDIHSGQTSAKVKLEEVHDDNHHSAKKRKLNKIITVKTEPYDEEDLTLPLLQQLANRVSTPESETDHGSHLILMSCLNCRIHVMVSNANPECPKCSRGDRLLDVYHGSPVKKTRIFL